MEQVPRPAAPQELRRELVFALDRAGPELAPDVGGKAANLGELIRAGLPVPAGFCLATRAYLTATSSAGLNDIHAGLVPETLIRALFRPEAALRRAERFGEHFRAALVVPAGSTPVQRLDHVERILAQELFPVVPNFLPLPALGFALLAVARRLLGPDGGPGALQPVLRGLPNNVTTEMDLSLWQLASAVRADAESAALFHGAVSGGAESKDAAVPELVRRYRAREYGIPAVVGVPDATSRIATGNRITVDGAAGTVVPEGGQADKSLPRGHA